MVGPAGSQASSAIEDDPVVAEEALSLPVVSSLFVAVFNQNASPSLTLGPVAGDVSVHDSPCIIDDFAVPEGDGAGHVVRAQVVGDDLGVVELEDGVHSGVDYVGEGYAVELGFLVGVVGEDDSKLVRLLVKPGVTDADQGVGRRSGKSRDESGDLIVLVGR